MDWFDSKKDAERAKKSGRGQNAPARFNSHSKAALVKAIRIDRAGQFSPLPSHRPRHRRFPDPNLKALQQ